MSKFNWKLSLFNYKQGLDIEQYDVMNIIEGHINQFDSYSEKEIYASLNEKLQAYAFDKGVVNMLEGLDTELKANTLTYELKDLYKKVERKNHGVLYRDSLNKILNIINKDDDDAKMESILNELKMYDWIPEIKGFIYNLSKSPIERQNMSNSGKAEKVFTLVENVVNENNKKDGYVVYVADRWFLIDDKEIKQTLLEECFKDDTDKIRKFRILEQAVKLSTIEDSKIKFRIDENLTISMSTKDGSIFLNEEKIDKGTSLENVFNSPIIPYIKKDYYVILNTVKENLEKFVELDIALKNSNVLNPFLECYAFNYKDKNYLYSVDKRTGSSFFEYESVNQLITDVQKELDYDLTHFYENKLSNELKHMKKLEEREQEIEMKIKEVNESIQELKDVENLMKEDVQLKAAFDNLLIHKHNLTKTLNNVKTERLEARKKMFSK
jgi:hypothetical protein